MAGERPLTLVLVPTLMAAAIGFIFSALTVELEFGVALDHLLPLAVRDLASHSVHPVIRSGDVDIVAHGGTSSIDGEDHALSRIASTTQQPRTCGPG